MKILDGVSQGGVSGRGGGPPDPMLIPEGCNCTIQTGTRREETTEVIPSRTEGGEHFKFRELLRILPVSIWNLPAIVLRNLNYVPKNPEAGRNHEVLTVSIEVFPLDCSLPAEAFQYLKIWATLLDTTRIP